MFKSTAHESPADTHSHQDPRWQVLFSGQPRALLVPAHDRRAQHRSVEFFIANPLHRLWAHALLEANRVWPGAPLLPALPASAPPLALAESPAHTAIQIGTPGPYQKASMLVMGDDSAPIALAKIALKESADPMVQNEAHWLCELDRHPSLSGQVPRLFAHGTARSGRRYLMLSIAPGRGSTNTFTPAHVAFLRDLSRIDIRAQTFADSPAYRYLADSLAWLRSIAPAPLSALLAEALDECSDRLRRWIGPFVLAHGDFAPWNLRRHRGGIFVFDWEYAEAGAIAVRDICHFLLIPRVLARGGVDPAQMRALVDEVGVIARAIHPQCVWERATVAALVLGCLLHTVLFYCVSRGGVPTDDPVIDAYCHLMRERAQWTD